MIEFVVVIAIIALTLPMIFGLYLLSMQNQQKARILSIVKENGDNALSTIEMLIRNRAVYIYNPNDETSPLCANKGDAVSIGNSVSFKDKDGNFFRFTLQESDPDSIKISSSSATNTQILTGQNVTITNLLFSCMRPSLYAPPVVSVTFTVSQKGETLRHEQKNSFLYATSIKLRN